MESTPEQASDERPGETAVAERTDFDSSRIAQVLQVRRTQVEKVARLLAEGHEPAFIARHRRDHTLGMPEELIWRIHEMITRQKAQSARKRELLASLASQNRLTPDIEEAIAEAEHPRRLEDIQAPLRPRRRSPSAPFREKGLNNLAEAIWLADPVLSDTDALDSLIREMADPDRRLGTAEEISDGLRLILAEVVADGPDIRSGLRHIIWESGRIRTTRNPGLSDVQASDHKEYWQFSDTLKQIPAHRVLGLARAERSGAITVTLEWDRAAAMELLVARMPLPTPDEGVQPSYAGLGIESLVPEPPAMPVATPEPEPTPEPEVLATVAEAATQPADLSVTEALSPPTEPAVVAVDGEVVSEVPAPVASTEEPAEAVADNPEAETAAVVTPVSSRVTQPAPPRHAPSFPVSARFHRLDRPELLANHPHAAFLHQVAVVAMEKVLVPAIEREIRRDLNQRAEEQAALVQERNLRTRLMTPPVAGRKVLGVDPTFRHGFRVAVIDETGKPLEYATLHPQGGPAHLEHASRKLEELIRRFQLELVAVGGGSASRKAEELVATVLRDLRLRREKGPEAAPPESEAPHTEVPQAEAAPTEVSQAEASYTEVPQAEAVPTEVVDALVVESPAQPATVDGVVALEGAEVPADVVVVEGAEASLVAEGTPAESTGPADPATPPSQGGKKNNRRPQQQQQRKEPPPPEPVSLEGLPESPVDLAYAIMPDPSSPMPGMEPEELRGIDGGLKAAVSVARMLQDPLRELIRFDPMHLAPGMHEVELNPRQWRDPMARVVRSCLCEVGLDLNRATAPELAQVAGWNPLVAQEIVAFRSKLEGGRFANREQLLQVPGIDAHRYLQGACFVRVVGGTEPLDSTWIHPEQYLLARRVLTEAGFTPEQLADESSLGAMAAKLQEMGVPALAQAVRAAVQAGELPGPAPSEGVLSDLVGMLIEPGRDLRHALRPPLMRNAASVIEDLKTGQQLEGRVLNVVDFGCFVDIGLREGGLVHISQMATRYIRNPYEVVRVGEPVRVWVINADTAKGRVSLSMLEPGQESQQPRGEANRRGREGQRAPGNRPPRRGGPGRGPMGAEGNPQGQPGSQQGFQGQPGNQGQGQQGQQGEAMRGAGRPPRPPREGDRQGTFRGPRPDRPAGPGGDRPGGQGGDRQGGPQRAGGRPDENRGRPGAAGRPGMAAKPGSSLPPRGSSRKEMGTRTRGPGQGFGGPGGGGQSRPPAGAGQSRPPEGAPAGTSPTDATPKPAARPPARQQQQQQQPQNPAASLSQGALAGASPLGSFAELAAFFAAQKDEAKGGGKPAGGNTNPGQGQPS